MWKILQTSNFEQAIITCGAYKAVALYHYFQPSDSLPDHSGPLSVSVSPVPIKDANEPVRSATRSKPRGKCAVKFNFIFQRSWESRWRLLRFRLGKEHAWLKLAARGKLVIRVISSQCTGAYEKKKIFFWRPYGHLYENLHLLKFSTIQYFTLPLLNVAHNCCPLLHSRYVCTLPLSFLAVCHNHHYLDLPALWLYLSCTKKLHIVCTLPTAITLNDSLQKTHFTNYTIHGCVVII